MWRGLMHGLSVTFGYSVYLISEIIENQWNTADDKFSLEL